MDRSAWPRATESRRPGRALDRSEEHTSELHSPDHLVCRLLLEKKKIEKRHHTLEDQHAGIYIYLNHSKHIVQRIVNAISLLIFKTSNLFLLQLYSLMLICTVSD